MGHKARPLYGKPETKEADEDTWQKPQPTPISGTAISVPGDWGERDSKGTAGLRRGVGTLQSESGLRKGSSWPRSRLPGRRWGSWHEKRWKGRMGQWSATGKKEATKGDTVSALTRGRSERLQVKRARRWAYLKATKAARKEAADEKFRAAWVAEARELWERDQEFEYLRQAGADERVEADESGPLEEANSIAEQEVLCGDTDGEVGADSGGWGQVDKEAGSGLGSNESEPVGPAAEEGGAREEEGNGTWCRCGAGVNAEGGTLPAIVVLVMRRRCIRWKARKWKKGGMDRRCPARIARRGKKQAEGQGQNEDGKQGQTEQAAERSGGGGMTWRGDKKAKRRAKKAAAREAKRQARRKVLMGKLKRFKMWGQDRKASAVGALLDKLPRGDEVAASKRRKWEKGATKRERIRAARDAELAEWLGLAGPASAILTTRRTITAHRRPLAKPPAPTPNSQTLKKSSPTLPPTTSPEAGLPGVGDLTLKPAAVTNGTPAVESVVAQPREPLSLDACTSLAAAKSPTAEPAVSPAGADLPMPVRAAPSEEEKDTAGEGCRPIGVEASAPLAGCEASTEVATATPGGWPRRNIQVLATLFGKGTVVVKADRCATAADILQVLQPKLGLPLDSLAVLNKGRKLLPTEVVTCDPSQEDVFLTVAHKNGLLGGAPLPDGAPSADELGRSNHPSKGFIKTPSKRPPEEQDEPFSPSYVRDKKRLYVTVARLERPPPTSSAEGPSSHRKASWEQTAVRPPPVTSNPRTPTYIRRDDIEVVTKGLEGMMSPTTKSASTASKGKEVDDSVMDREKVAVGPRGDCIRGSGPTSPTGGPPAPKKKRVTKDGWQERVKQILRADAIASSLETLSIEESSSKETTQHLQATEVGSRTHGLRNYDRTTTCYQNAALQALANIPELIDFIIDAHSTFETGGLALALARLVQSMWAPGRDGSLHKRTQEFNDAVYAFGRQKRPPTFVRGTHQDISEFIWFLLEELLSAARKLHHPAAKVFSDCFKGSFSMVISCPCGGTSQAMTPHEGPVMVDIPGDADEVRLEDCLRFWGSGKEHIEGWDCPRCGVKGGTKQMNLEKGPDELIIAVSRFDGGPEGRRRNTKITYPLTGLVVGRSNVTYNLQTVMNHLGQFIHEGHYVAQGKSGGSWYYWNDELVTARHVTSERQESRGAYVFRYRRAGLDDTVRASVLLETRFPTSSASANQRTTVQTATGEQAREFAKNIGAQKFNVGTAATKKKGHDQWQKSKGKSLAAASSHPAQLFMTNFFQPLQSATVDEANGEAVLERSDAEVLACGACGRDHLQDQFVSCSGGCGTDVHFFCTPDLEEKPMEEELWYCEVCKDGNGSLRAARRKGRSSSHGQGDASTTAEFNVAADSVCRICSGLRHPTVMLVCETCKTCTHAYCVQPSVQAIPKGDWFCDDKCEAEQREESTEEEGGQKKKKRPTSAKRHKRGKGTAKRKNRTSKKVATQKARAPPKKSHAVRASDPDCEGSDVSSGAESADKDYAPAEGASDKHKTSVKDKVRGDKQQAETDAFLEFNKASTPKFEGGGVNPPFKIKLYNTNDGSCTADMMALDDNAAREFLHGFGTADDPYDGATGFPIELKTIRYVLSHNGVTESLQGGSDIKKKLKAMLKLAGPEGDFILAHIVQGDVARGEDPGPHPTKARPAAPDTPVEYIRLLSARTAKKSSTTITKNSLEKWKHTVVPTKNCMHLEVIRRLLIKHADKLLRLGVNKMQVPVSPTTLKEYGYQRRLEQFLMYVMDRLLGNPKSDGFLRAMFSNPYLVRTQQGKTGTFLPTRKSDNLHFAIAGWHEKEYYGGVRGSRSSHPLDVSFVLLLVHLPEVFKEADLEGVDEEIVDRAEEIAGGMVAVRLDVLIELGAIPFRKRSGGALVPRKFKSLCVEVEGTAGSRRAWVYTKVSGRKLRCAFVPMDDCVGERLNDCMADYVPFDKREVDTWQGQVEKQLAYSKAIEGQQAVPHPNEAEIEEVFQGIELFKEIPPEKGSHFNINDVAKQAEHYQVTAKVSRGALSSVIDPGRKKRLKALKRRARALGLEGRAMTGITCSTEPNRKQRWQGQHNHDGYNFSLRSEEEGPVTEFRDLVILMLRKEKTHALHLGVKEYPAHKYYEHKLSTPEEWAAGTGPGYKTFKAWKDSR